MEYPRCSAGRSDRFTRGWTSAQGQERRSVRSEAAMPLLLDTVVRASRWQGLHGRVALHADHRGKSQHQDDLVSSVG